MKMMILGAHRNIGFEIAIEITTQLFFMTLFVNLNHILSIQYLDLTLIILYQT